MLSPALRQRSGYCFDTHDRFLALTTVRYITQKMLVLALSIEAEREGVQECLRYSFTNVSYIPSIRRQISSLFQQRCDRLQGALKGFQFLLQLSVFALLVISRRDGSVIYARRQRCESDDVANAESEDACGCCHAACYLLHLQGRAVSSTGSNKQNLITCFRRSVNTQCC